MKNIQIARGGMREGTIANWPASFAWPVSDWKAADDRERIQSQITLSLFSMPARNRDAGYAFSSIVSFVI